MPSNQNNSDNDAEQFHEISTDENVKIKSKFADFLFCFISY